MKNQFGDKLIDRYFIELNKNDRSGAYGLTQILFAYNSNKIEGSTLSVEQTASLFKTGTIFADAEIIKAKDIEEMNGHFLMFNEMLKTYNEPLSHELIKRYHFRLKSGVFEDLLNGYKAGDYKTRANMVANITTAKPQDVYNLMEDLLNKYNSKDIHTIEEIAMFHAEYEKIHPFQDGNGRTGRIIIFKECLKNNIIPLIIDDNDKLMYYKALNLAQKEQKYDSLISMFKEAQEKFFELSRDFVLEYEQ